MSTIALQNPSLKLEHAVRLGLSVSACNPILRCGQTITQWVQAAAAQQWTNSELCPLDALDRWRVEEDSRDIVHETGAFFAIRGLEVSNFPGRVSNWVQPIVDQPEVGILGILAAELDGVLHFLIQAKSEPGNANGIQLSPTVQATRSNYTRAHGGAEVPYLRYFLEPDRYRILTDVLQSEQAAWFRLKRNRNMIVATTEAVEVLPGFTWMTLGQLHHALTLPDLVNMDTRTVLACLPIEGTSAAVGLAGTDNELSRAVQRSSDANAGAVSDPPEVLSWITEHRCRAGAVGVRVVPLRESFKGGWHWDDEGIHHRSGRYFSIRGLQVTSSGREVATWAQPVLSPPGGLAALVLAIMSGIAHVLVRIAVSPGYREGVELAPTVQCTPLNYLAGSPHSRPAYLDLVEEARPEELLYDTVLSEEGGRFYHAHTRYVIVHSEDKVERTLPPQFKWLTLSQLTNLLAHSNYVNVELRTLVASLRSLIVRGSVL